MLKALFSSKARIRLLRLLLIDPKGRFYLRELASKSGLQPLSVQRELANLTEAGILLKEISGRQTYYQINERCPIIPELRSIFVKTVGVADVLRSALTELSDRIRVAFIYGSFAKGLQTAESDIDLMVIGDLDFGELVSALRLAEDQLGREVNPSVFTANEVHGRMADKDHFITTVLKEEKVYLIGDEHDFGELG